MSFTQAAQVSVVGDAVLIRHVYVPSTGLSYLVYTISEEKGDAVLYRPILAPSDLDYATRPNPGDERRIKIGSRRIKTMSLIALEEPGHVLMVFDDGKGLWKLTQDFAEHVQVSPPEQALDGEIPVLARDNIIRVFYVRDQDVKLRNDFGSEITLVEPSERDIVDMDVKMRAGISIARYAGLHVIDKEIALPLRPDANTELLYLNYFTSVSTDYNGLPAGTVSYYTFDTEDFDGSGNILDQVGNNNGSLIGSTVDSPGIVDQSRKFDGNDAYNLGNPSSLRITGDQFIAMWLKPNNFNARRNPWAKAYGGEGTITIETSGDVNYYWGAGGGNTSPYQGFRMTDSLTADVWQHLIIVRNLTSGYLRWYKNGVPVNEAVPDFAAATASGLSAYIGQGYVNRYVGYMDELLIGSQPLTDAEANALYQKGLNGIEARGNITLNEIRLDDQSGNNRNTTLPPHGVLATPYGVYFYDNMSMNLAEFPLGSAITIEAWITPNFRYHVGNIISGEIELKYKNNGQLTFSFSGATLKGFTRFKPHTPNHVVVRHVFGDGSQTFMVVNGKVVPASWVSGTGDEALALSKSLSVALAKGDALNGIKISNVAISLDDIRAYLGGRL